MINFFKTRQSIFLLKHKNNTQTLRKENNLARKQTETITIRVTQKEKNELQKKMKTSSSPSMRQFILGMCMDGKIIVNDELKKLNSELRYQGNNLNQLTKCVHQGKITVLNFQELLLTYRKILNELRGETNGNC